MQTLQAASQLLSRGGAVVALIGDFQGIAADKALADRAPGRALHLARAELATKAGATGFDQRNSQFRLPGSEAL